MGNPLNISQNTDPTAQLNNWARQLDATFNGMSRRLDRLTESTAAATAAAVAASVAAAGAVTSVSASESGVTIDGIIHSLVTAQYTSPSPIGTFAGVFLVATGYHGSSTPVKIAEDTFFGGPGVAQSFAVPLDRTGETITLYFVSKNTQEVALQSDWTTAPSTTVVLDGNASAPVAPSGVVATPSFKSIALQWSPNAETNLKNYNIYRYPSNTPASATVIATAAAGLNTGILAYLDTTGTIQTTYYYWITAVNTAGQESAKSSVVSGAQAVDVPLLNSAFEYGIGGNGAQVQDDSGWNVRLGNAADATWDTNPNSLGAFQGTRSVKLVGTTGNMTLLRNLFNVTCKAGDQLYATVAYTCSAAGVKAAAAMGWYNSTGTRISGTGTLSPTNLVGSWGTAKQVHVAPANAAYAQFEVYYDSSSTSNGSVWFDACGLSFVITSQQVVSVNTANAPQVSTILAQSGATTTINISASTYNFGFGTIGYNSGSVNPGVYGTFYIYADDVGYQGGAVTYNYTTKGADLTANDWRVSFGKITTAGGGGATGGGGGGGPCPLSGAPVRLYGDPSWWKMTVVPYEDFIRIETITGRTGYFSAIDRRFNRRGLLPLTDWVIGDYALTEDGEEMVVKLDRVHIPGATVDRYEATQGHIYSAWGFIGHNMKAL